MLNHSENLKKLYKILPKVTANGIGYYLGKTKELAFAGIEDSDYHLITEKGELLLYNSTTLLPISRHLDYDCWQLDKDNMLFYNTAANGQFNSSIA